MVQAEQPQAARLTHDAERVDIRGWRQAPVLQYLRRAVRDRAEVLRRVMRDAVAEHARQPEVRKLRNLTEAAVDRVDQQHVGCFQVAVHDLLAVQVCHALCNLCQPTQETSLEATGGGSRTSSGGRRVCMSVMQTVWRCRFWCGAGSGCALLGPNQQAKPGPVI